MKRLYEEDNIFKVGRTEFKRTQENFFFYLRIVAKYKLHIHIDSNGYDRSRN